MAFDQFGIPIGGRHQLDFLRRNGTGVTGFFEVGVGLRFLEIGAKKGPKAMSAPPPASRCGAMTPRIIPPACRCRRRRIARAAGEVSVAPILPPLTPAELLEASMIAPVAGEIEGGALTDRGARRHELGIFACIVREGEMASRLGTGIAPGRLRSNSHGAYQVRMVITIRRFLIFVWFVTLACPVSVRAADFVLARKSEVLCTRTTSKDGKVEYNSCSSSMYLFNKQTSDIFDCSFDWALNVETATKKILLDSVGSHQCTKFTRPFTGNANYTMEAPPAFILIYPSTRNLGDAFWVGANDHFEMKACVRFIVTAVGTQHRCNDIDLH
jgi:hypothetical protein